MSNTWSPTTWRDLPIRQQPSYPDVAAKVAMEERLRTCPPLVFAGEARDLRSQLGAVAEGRAFLLQGGDCAEAFAEFHPDYFRALSFTSLVPTPIRLRRYPEYSINQRHIASSIFKFSDILSSKALLILGIMPSTDWTPLSIAPLL